MILSTEQDIHAPRTNENEASNDQQQQSVHTATTNRSPYYNVKENCALASFLREHQVSLPVQLNVILTVLKEYILSRACFDPSNSSIILCSQLLENIFGMKSLHVVQVKAALMKFLTLAPAPPPPAHPASTPCPPAVSLFASSSTGSRRPRPAVNADNSCTRFRYSAQFAATVLPGGTDPDQIVTFRQAAEAISAYILSRKMHLIDSRNILIANVKDDPLGKLFGVQAFHRSQTKQFLAKHLIPVIGESGIAPHVQDDLPGAHQENIAVTSSRQMAAAAGSRKRSCGEQAVNLTCSSHGKQARTEIL